MNQPDRNEKTMGRRELLKALAATGGAITAASLLPGQWSKPSIEVGVLPAHAQSSQLTISGLNVGPVAGAVGSQQFNASFNYNDPVGKVSDASMLYANIDPDGTLYNGDSIGSVGGRSGNGFSGSAYFLFNYLINGSGTLYLQLKADDGRLSNTDDASINPI